MKNIVVLSGSSNRSLALKISKSLDVKLGKMELESFPDGEDRIRILSDVRGKTVFIVQSTCSNVDKEIIELALIADAAKRKGAKRIIAVMPFFGYSAQDKVFRKGEPLSSRVVVRMLEATSINEFIIVDIHSTSVLRMFRKKVYHLSSMPIFIDYFKGKLKGEWCVVALDNGASERAKEFAGALDFPLVQFDKTRDRKTGEVTFHALSGNVKGKNVISFDDFVSTGGTRIQGCDWLKKQGVKKYYDCVTHLIVPETCGKLKKSRIDRMFISDSVCLDPSLKFSRLKILSIASVLAEFIKKHS